MDHHRLLLLAAGSVKMWPKKILAIKFEIGIMVRVFGLWTWNQVFWHHPLRRVTRILYSVDLISISQRVHPTDSQGTWAQC